jgi:catechol 2,3-dioxygenase-like lactoylglutathione lyase family enzyme
VSVSITAVHPVLMAREVAASLAFYARLGFAPDFTDDPVAPRYAGIRRGPVELHLQWADPGQWAHAGDRPAYRFLTPNVDALYAEFRAAGGITPAALDGQAERSPFAAPADTPWGTREFHVRDPGGNVLQFCGPQTASDEPEQPARQVTLWSEDMGNTF